MMEQDRKIQYENIVSVGETLGEVMDEPDVLPLLKSAVNAGASVAMINDADGHTLYLYGNLTGDAEVTVKKPVLLKGEVAGHIIIRGESDSEGLLDAVAEIIYNAVNIILQCNFKTIPAAETHNMVFHQSCEKTLATNRKPKQSEGRYRELANSLEIQVQQRTEELRQAHAKLLHQEKLSSIGQLASGIAHEINNPLGFISSNINTLNKYFAKIKDMLFFYRETLNNHNMPAENRETSKQKWNNLKLDFIIPDIDDLIKESISGAARVKKIVADLKGFSHIDEASALNADINAEIDRTLSVLTHEIRQDAEIIRDYGTLPAFYCNPAHICQAFFNVVLNAIQAAGEGLVLTITTRSTNSLIQLTFSDNGPGIPENIRHRIFEPFFTTKEVGTGTGMGLNVTYEIITSYGGTIEVDSKTGTGTTFRILLPLLSREIKKYNYNPGTKGV